MRKGNKMFYTSVLLRELTIGCVVRSFPVSSDDHWETEIGDERDKIGHVIGFSLNASKEVIVTVRWADGFEFNHHPSTIALL